jgi:hypothetical protein
VSIVLLGISVWIRLQLNESPLFQQMKAEGRTSKQPISESFCGRQRQDRAAGAVWRHRRPGRGLVRGPVLRLFFLTQTLKVDATTANLLIAAALVIGTPFFIVFGWLSDKIGRKSDHHGRLPDRGADLLSHLQGSDPLCESSAGSGCGIQPGDGERRSVEPARSSSTRSVRRASPAPATSPRRRSPKAARRIRTQAVGAGMSATIRVGNIDPVASFEGAGLDAEAASAQAARFNGELQAALAAAGYPD